MPISSFNSHNLFFYTDSRDIIAVLQMLLIVTSLTMIMVGNGHNAPWT